MKRRDLIAHLQAQGCALVREGAKHSWWGNPANNRRTAVPRHSEISDHLAQKICRDLGIADP
jgi:mRNA interferase HicA